MANVKRVGLAGTKFLLATGLVLVVTVIFCLTQSVELDRADTGPEPMIKINGPLIVSPPVVPSDQVKLPDDCQVIGVTHNGKSRAYVVSALHGSHHHIVNDLVGGKPFTITYCDRNNCTRVFTRHDSPVPLNITVGGWLGKDSFGTLMLRVGPNLYRQDTLQAISALGEIPFPTTDFERTTWKEWRSKHPQSDVYTEMPKRPFRGPEIKNL